MTLSDGTHIDVTIGLGSKRIEILKQSLGESTMRALPPMTRSEFKTFIDELSVSYEGSKWSVDQGHLLEK